MKNLLIMIPFLLFVRNAYADDSFDTAVIEDEVLKKFDELVAVSKSLDADTYLGFYNPEKFSALNENGTVTHDFSEFSQSIRRNFTAFKGYQELSFSNVKVIVLDANTVILVNEFQATVILNNNERASAGGAGTQVWQKFESQWKLVNVSSSPKAINNLP